MHKEHAERVDASRKAFADRAHGVVPVHGGDGSDLMHTWHAGHEAAKPYVENATHLAMFAAAPVPYAIIRGTHFALSNTLGRVPVLGYLYNKPAEMAAGAVKTATDVAAGVITSPLLVHDAARDVAQGFSNVATPAMEARHPVTRAFEKFFHAVGDIGEWSVDKVKYVFNKGVELGGKGLELGGKVIAAPFHAFGKIEEMVDGGVKQIPIVGSTGPLTHIISGGLTLAGIHFIGMNYLPHLYQPILNFLGNAINLVV